MGQKSNPNGLRLGIIRNWESRWYSDDKKVPILVLEDFNIRNLIKKFYPKGIIGKIEIKRLKKSDSEQIEIDIYTSKIGLIQGAENKTKNNLIKKIEELIRKKIEINVFEIKMFEKNASLVAQNIAMQLENRVFFKVAQKMAVQKALKKGAKGVKISVSGRLGGAEIARRENISLGLVPLNTLRADIDYAFDEARTIYGVIGIQVWIFNDEILPIKNNNNNK
ncbi:MAG: 30S ribosomal protein S3 [Candidatus Phytoplasma cynodontis]|uniref:30S ribosomal protein S3 n=1 Tax='Cynodon dactylon' phytoplasma TaxID=295320 RepID=UPI001265C67E|nr:30S ribosomal protein S3 ['Cynodon dactylon' phytoplasma]KAB8121981.1 30S ribosomal protein S3 ['Cynodon dactylon' phytoplasma]WIA07605.1 MAG: 30S ribosomal protein S3 [Candidatus Phytoplasma cynodontis]